MIFREIQTHGKFELRLLKDFVFVPFRILKTIPQNWQMRQKIITLRMDQAIILLKRLTSRKKESAVDQGREKKKINIGVNDPEGRHQLHLREEGTTMAARGSHLNQICTGGVTAAAVVLGVMRNAESTDRGNVFGF